MRYLLTIAALALLASCSKTPEATPQPKPAAPPASAEADVAPAGDGAPLLSAGLREGTDYVLIPGGTPFATPAGQVEVAEMFNYACPACDAFEPMLRDWRKTLPAYVHLVYLPLDFRPDFVPYSHAYYAAEALGLVEQSHEAVYAAIHQTHKLPGEGSPADSATIARFYAQFGVPAEKFQKLMDSQEIAAKTAAARAFAMRCQVNSTPSLVIDGKYRVAGSSWADLLNNASRLIAKAHAE